MFQQFGAIGCEIYFQFVGALRSAKIGKMWKISEEMPMEGWHDNAAGLMLALSQSFKVVAVVCSWPDAWNGCNSRMGHKSNELKNALLNKRAQKEQRLRQGCSRHGHVWQSLQVPVATTTQLNSTRLDCLLASSLVEICALLHFDLLLWLDNWLHLP